MGDPLAGPNIVYGGINPARLGLTGQALFHGPTIYESLRAHARLMPTLQSNVQLGLKVRGDKAYWFLNFVGSDPDAMGVLTEGAITLVLEVIRHVVGAHWSPDYIEFSHQPRTTIDRYETRLRAPVRFRRGPASAIVLDSSILAVGAIACTRWRSSFLLLSEPNVYDASMFAEVVDLPRSPDQLIDSISCIVDGMLMAAEVSMPRTSAALGYPPRTLQRALSAVGTSFEAIVDDRRRSRSIELLADPNLCVADVAMAVGYSDTAHFIRAFRRWHCKSPTEYRRSAETGAKWQYKTDQPAKGVRSGRS